LPRRKRPICPGKVINLDDHWVMLLEISWTIEFFPLARPPRKPRPPPAGVFFSHSVVLSPAGSPATPYPRLMRPRPRAGRRRLGPRADRPRCGRRASSASSSPSRRSGISADACALDPSINRPCIR
jgi:hypothetical protein